MAAARREGDFRREKLISLLVDELMMVPHCVCTCVCIWSVGCVVLGDMNGLTFWQHGMASHTFFFSGVVDCYRYGAFSLLVAKMLMAQSCQFLWEGREGIVDCAMASNCWLQRIVSVPTPRISYSSELLILDSSLFPGKASVVGQHGIVDLFFLMMRPEKRQGRKAGEVDGVTGIKMFVFLWVG